MERLKLVQQVQKMQLQNKNIFMMNDYRYILEPYKGKKTRYRCPNCLKNGVFTRYVDQQTNEYLSSTVGICNRKDKCSYHYSPKQFFDINDISSTSLPKPRNSVTHQPKRKPVSIIDKCILEKSKSSESPNYFIDYLSSLWGKDVAFILAEKYHIGTSTHWKGATVFWQIDTIGRIRAGKLMLYNPITGKRKAKYNSWVHSIMNYDDFNLKQCFFGEHLLNKSSTKPVAIVESEKTAVIASIMMPDYTWLACGGMGNLNKEKTQVLKNRDVILFPDLGNGYMKWKSSMNELEHLASCQISTLLEEKATPNERENGLDIADYLVKFIE